MSVTLADYTHPDCPLVYVNQAFTDTTGYTYNEVVGQNCRFLQGEDTDPKAVKKIAQAIKAQCSLSIDLLNYKKDGTPFMNRLELAPIMGVNNEAIAYSGFQTDLSYHERNIEEIDNIKRRLDASLYKILLKS